jgi:hypothetical protein
MVSEKTALGLQRVPALVKSEIAGAFYFINNLYFI